MAERRSLVQGIKKSSPPVDPVLEHEFVYGKKPPEPAPQAARQAASNQPITRTPFSSKIRTDYAEALKRASLERQLKKTYPNTLQEIIEEALEPWLKNNGYLP
jgi:hypothetical protein